MQALKDCQGKISAMRIGLLSCIVTGSILCFGGLFGSYLGVQDASNIINSGAMLMGSSGFAKAIQSKYEKGV